MPFLIEEEGEKKGRTKKNRGEQRTLGKGSEVHGLGGGEEKKRERGKRLRGKGGKKRGGGGKVWLALSPFYPSIKKKKKKGKGGEKGK